MDIFDFFFTGYYFLLYEVKFHEFCLPHLEFDMHSALSSLALNDAKRCLHWRLVSPN